MRGELVGAIHLHEEAALILEDLVFHDQNIGQRGLADNQLHGKSIMVVILRCRGPSRRARLSLDTSQRVEDLPGARDT